MRDFLLSLTLWILLPVLLILVNALAGGNVLFLILLLTWLGFGAFFIVPSDGQG